MGRSRYGVNAPLNRIWDVQRDPLIAQGRIGDINTKHTLRQSDNLTRSRCIPSPP